MSFISVRLSGITERKPREDANEKQLNEPLKYHIRTNIISNNQQLSSRQLEQTSRATHHPDIFR